jgi:hypothetical protein
VELLQVAAAILMKMIERRKGASFPFLLYRPSWVSRKKEVSLLGEKGREKELNIPPLTGDWRCRGNGKNGKKEEMDGRHSPSAMTERGRGKKVQATIGGRWEIEGNEYFYTGTILDFVICQENIFLSIIFENICCQIHLRENLARPKVALAQNALWRSKKRHFLLLEGNDANGGNGPKEAFWQDYVWRRKWGQLAIEWPGNGGANEGMEWTGGGGGC